jgi:hypothetical protein
MNHGSVTHRVTEQHLSPNPTMLNEDEVNQKIEPVALAYLNYLADPRYNGPGESGPVPLLVQKLNEIFELDHALRGSSFYTFTFAYSPLHVICILTLRV